MNTYYQKHKTIHGFQFNGQMTQIVNEMPTWANMFFNYGNIINYDNQHRIISIKKINDYLNDNNAYWPNQYYKNRKWKHKTYQHFQNGNFIMQNNYKRLMIFQTLNYGDYITIHYHLDGTGFIGENYNNDNGRGDKLFNQISEAYRSKYAKHMQRDKYNRFHIHIGPEKDKNYDFHFCRYFKIWSKENFEAHWSKTPIKRRN